MKISKALVRIVLLSFMFMQTVPAIAGIIDTDSFLNEQSVQQDREKLNSFMASDKVRSLLQNNGLTVEQAKKRVAALSASEVKTLAEKYVELPAAGSAAGGILIIALFVLILELSGLTDISEEL